MSDTIERLNTALEGRYEVEREIGEGGMATVFLAKDLKHNRNVALKVLKPELAAVVGAERFLAEIETTANLQHPHILPLHDSGEADGFLYYVMPHVEGETLADRIGREAQLPVDEALGIAISVCNALQVAHEAGVVHRDIKPGNILLSRGEPLVADFGIALAVGAGGSRLTETGLSVGTPFYMSPEQATGDQAIGPSADIYAVACVLYEMLVGEPPYLGNTAQAVLGKIIQGIPVSATAARKSVPANVDAAIRMALEKLPADRFTRAADFAGALSDPAFRHGAEPRAIGTADVKRWKAAAIVASVVAVVAVGAGSMGLLGSRQVERQVLRQKIEASSLGMFVPWGQFMALAPDGSGMAYIDRLDDGPLQIFYKARDEAEGTPLPGTEEPDALVLSPDGQFVAFAKNNTLITRPVRGGAATTLAGGVDSGVVGLDWLADGTILFELDDGDALARIPADGSAAVDTIVALGSMRYAHGIEGHEAAIVLRCPGCDMGIVDLQTGDVAWVLEDIARAWYVPTGHIVYVTSAGAVFATPFDPETREMAPVGTPLFEGVRTGPGYADMHVADDGTMVYVTGGTGAFTGDTEWVAWVDREGNFERVDPDWPAMNLEPAQLSPDGGRIALSIAGELGRDVYVHQLPDGPRTRLTPADGAYLDPIWMPDGRSLLFTNLAGDGARLLQARADGSSPRPEVLVTFEDDILAPQFVHGGAGVVFAYAPDVGRSVIRSFDFGADSTTLLHAVEDFELTAPTVSPDGRWLAYTSDVTGQAEIFVRPFPDVSDSRAQVSNGGGWEPVWSKSGNEIFYVNREEYLTSATYVADSTFTVTERKQLFEVGRDYIRRPRKRSYDVDLTGERFLMIRNAEAGDVTQEAIEGDMILVQNWFEELRARLGGGE